MQHWWNVNSSSDSGHCEECVFRTKIRRTKQSALVNEVSACNNMESVCYTTVRKKVWVKVVQQYRSGYLWMGAAADGWYLMSLAIASSGMIMASCLFNLVIGSPCCRASILLIWMFEKYRDSMQEAWERCLLSCIWLLILEIEDWISYVTLYLTCFTDMIWGTNCIEEVIFGHIPGSMQISRLWLIIRLFGAAFL